MSDEGFVEITSEIQRAVKEEFEKERKKREQAEKEFFSYSSWAEAYKDSTKEQRAKLWALFEKSVKERRKTQGMVVNPEFRANEQFEVWADEEQQKERARLKEGIVGIEREVIAKQKKRLK